MLFALREVFLSCTIGRGHLLLYVPRGYFLWCGLLHEGGVFFAGDNLRFNPLGELVSGVIFLEYFCSVPLEEDFFCGV